MEDLKVNGEQKTIKIGNKEIFVKVYKGQRVVTFKDIDMAHERPDGTARKRFADNKKHFVEDEDYFLITPKTLVNIELSEKQTLENDVKSNRGTIFITESGYLMLVKSFTDDLAWEVQRKLVNTYFRGKQDSNIYDIPKDYSSALRLAADEYDKRIIAERQRDVAIKQAAEKEQQLELQKPFVQAVIKLQNTDGTVSLKEAADMICGNGLQIGRNTMMALLRKHKILTKNNEAINRYVQQDIFRVVQTTKVDQYGKTRIFSTTRVTAKGLIYLNTRVKEWLGVEQLDDFEKIISNGKYAWLELV